MSAEPPVVQLADSISRVLYGVVSALVMLIGLVLVLAGFNWPVQGGMTMGTLVMLVVLVIAGAVTVAGGAFANPWIRSALNRRHPPTRFGTVHAVDERVIQPTDEPVGACTECGARVDRGLHRRYREEFALFGIPVYTASVGHNHYCLDCASEELGLDGSTGRPGRANDRPPVDTPAGSRRDADPVAGERADRDESVLRE